MGPRVRAALATVLLLGLAGCLWPAPGAGPDRRAHNPLEKKITPDTVASLEEAWVASTEGGAVRGPVTSDNGVHVSVGGRLYGFDRETGSQLWVKHDPDVPDWVTMGPAMFVDDVLWASYGIGNLGGTYVTQLLDPATGEVVGSPSVSGIVDGVRGDRYVLSHVGFGSGTPIGLSVIVGDLQDPEVGWSRLIDVRAFGSAGGWTPLTLGEDHVYQAGSRLLVQDGETTQGNGVRGYSIENPSSCPPPYPSNYACPVWTADLDGTQATSPVLTGDGSTLFTATNAGTVYAVDAATGTVSWSRSVGSDVPAEPALADGSLFVPVGWPARGPRRGQRNGSLEGTGR